MDTQRAINNLACMKMEIQDAEDVRQLKRVRIDTVDVAISALKKQIPMKHDEEDCCIICQTYLKDDNGVEGEYCPNCGQRAEW